MAGPSNMRPRGSYHMRRMPPESLGMRHMPPDSLGQPLPGLRPPSMQGCRMPPPNRMPFGQRGPPSLINSLPNIGHCMRPPPPPHMMRPMGPSHMMPAFGARGPRFRLPLPSQMDQYRRIQEGRVIKKKQFSLRYMDMFKPWVTEQIKEEFNKKDLLLQSAKATQEPADWSQYRNQREKCSKLYTMAKLKYVGLHPEEAHLHIEDSSELANNKSIAEDVNEDNYNEMIPPDDLYCENCDKTFYNKNGYTKHVSQHRTCSIDGCTFIAHTTIVEKHILMQHVTGLYKEINNKNTPEDIEKWLKDRKNKYPTIRNVQIKRKIEEQMLKRGERLFNKSKRFNNKTQFERNKKGKRKKSRGKSQFSDQIKITSTKPPTLIDDKSNWNGKMFPFQGTNCLYGIKEEILEQSEFDDSEWSVECVNAEDKQMPSNYPQLVQPPINNNVDGLSFLIGNYSDSDQSDDETSTIANDDAKPSCSNDTNPNDTLVKNLHDKADGNGTFCKEVTDSNKFNVALKLLQADEVHCNEDEEPPLEEKIIRCRENVCENEIEKPTTSRENRKEKTKKTNKPQKRKTSNELNFYKRRRKPTLLEELLKDEIKHERNVLLQCVRYVVNKNFFR